PPACSGSREPWPAEALARDPCGRTADACGPHGRHAGVPDRRHGTRPYGAHLGGPAAQPYGRHMGAHEPCAAHQRAVRPDTWRAARPALVRAVRLALPDQQRLGDLAEEAVRVAERAV